MEIERPFASTFDFEVLPEVPGKAQRRFFFPGPSEAGGQDGLTIRVEPHEGEAWLGTFAFGYIGSDFLTRVVSTPRPSQLCVIANGQVYLVNASEPKSCEAMSVGPVFDMRTSAKHQLLILASYQWIFAVGGQGIAWKNDHDYWDGVKLTTMTDDALSGVVWEDRSGWHEWQFTLDLATGLLTLGGETG